MCPIEKIALANVWTASEVNSHLLQRVAGTHPVVHDHAVVGGAVWVMFFVPRGADLVQILLLV